MLQYKIVNYFGNYGPANFWSNIKDEDIIIDLRFIKDKGFNAILLLVPYASFKPHADSFESKFEKTLNNIFEIARALGLDIILRIGYLWESSFREDRTFERYLDMYSCYKSRKESIYENDFIDFLNYFYNNYEFLHMIISWEDFFWPIHHYNQDKRNEDQYIEKETVRFVTYLLKKIGHKDRLHIEQRTNGDFDKIEYNDSVSYAYYNTFNILGWEDDLVGHNFGRGVIIDESLLIPKHFIEWYSRLKQILNLDSSHKLIIDQFNVIDNTFQDDLFHNNQIRAKTKLGCSVENLNSVFEFLAPIINHNIYGIGFWSLWTTVSGHIYNGTFKFGTEGWETDGIYDNGRIKLNLFQSISTNLGYVRLDSSLTWNIYINYSTSKSSKIILRFNNTNEVIKLERGECNWLERSFEFIGNKELSVICFIGEIVINRIDCFNMKHESFLYDEKRKEIGNTSFLNGFLHAT